VDAAIGLKGGVNFNGRKNYLGCFEAPDGVLVDPSFLATLSARDLRSGVAEMLKMALVRDSQLFSVIEASGTTLIESAFTEPHDVSRSSIHAAVASMLAELEPNPYEDRTDKRCVDFGHTFSGAMEERSQYDLKHGEAVAIDMMISSLLANELGLLANAALERIIDIYRRLVLPTSSEYSTMEILDEGLVGSIAHRGGTLNLVLPTGIGSSTFIERRDDVPDGALAAALERSLELDTVGTLPSG
jgi:3-dehydroquinate synthase